MTTPLRTSPFDAAAAQSLRLACKSRCGHTLKWPACGSGSGRADLSLSPANNGTLDSFSGSKLESDTTFAPQQRHLSWKATARRTDKRPLLRCVRNGQGSGGQGGEVDMEVEGKRKNYGAATIKLYDMHFMVNWKCIEPENKRRRRSRPSRLDQVR